MMWSYGWGHWFGMGIIMILFWALLVTGLVVLVRHLGDTSDRRPSTGASGQRDPEQLLAERFARGEIDEEDYRQRRELLRERG